MNTLQNGENLADALQKRGQCPEFTLGVGVRAFNPSSWKAQASCLCEFEARFIYIVSVMKHGVT